MFFFPHAGSRHKRRLRAGASSRRSEAADNDIVYLIVRMSFTMAFDTCGNLRMYIRDWNAIGFKVLIS